MSRVNQYIQTIFRLGIANVAYVTWYRFSLKSGIRRYMFPKRKFLITENIFRPCKVHNNYPISWTNTLLEDADKIINGNIRYYSYHWEKIGNPPNWFLNPFNNQTYPENQRHWTKLPDFVTEVGDIKNIWEASRFEWLNTLSRAFAVTGKAEYLDTLNTWIKDWTVENSINEGPNWKCGQEASIRVFNLINAALILDQADKPTSWLCELIYAHLERINSNILYAIAQDNNHGTSEASALYIGGNWLNSISKSYPKALQFSIRGRKWLENRINKLVENDGGFSQYSVTYHRVVLETLIFTEFWRQKLVLPPLSDNFSLKAKSAINWLWMLTDDDSGNCPNLGSNDGSFFLIMHSCDYRDFRPTLQTALFLFLGRKYYDKGEWDEPLYWYGKFDESTKKNDKQRESSLLGSGYVMMKSSYSWCLLRLPYFRFRPSHNDVFHFDLWYKGQNIMPDSGTYSYYPPISQRLIDYRSVHFHNTVSFDMQEQMPKMGRFLLGNWLKAENINEIQNNKDGNQEWSGSYIDNNRNRNFRRILSKDNIWQINDELSGVFKEAIIGFNISDNNCTLKGNILETNFGRIIIPDNAVPSLSISEVSDYYMEKHSIKRLSLKICKPGTYRTIIELTN